MFIFLGEELPERQTFMTNVCSLRKVLSNCTGSNIINNMVLQFMLLHSGKPPENLLMVEIRKGYFCLTITLVFFSIT